VLRILNWDLYIDFDENVSADNPLAKQSPTLREFAEKFDCEIEYHQYVTAEDMTARVWEMDGYYDVLVLNPASAGRMLKAEWLMPIPQEKVPNIRYVDECAKTSPVDPEGRYLIPYMNSYVGLLYQPDKVRRDDASWDLFFNPPAHFTDHLGLYDSASLIFNVALLANGVTNFSSPAEKDILKVQQIITRLKKEFNPRIVSSAERVRNEIFEGDIWLGLLYSTDAHNVLRLDEENKYAFRIPPEGTMLDHDYLAVHRNSQNPALAFEFINFILEPHVMGRIATYLGAEPPSAEARRIQGPLQLPRAMDEQGCPRENMYVAFDQPLDFFLYWFEALNLPENADTPSPTPDAARMTPSPGNRPEESL
jgi:spermidine/putrescine transport system substrate-binding protein